MALTPQFAGLAYQWGFPYSRQFGPVCSTPSEQIGVFHTVVQYQSVGLVQGRANEPQCNMFHLSDWELVLGIFVPLLLISAPELVTPLLLSPLCWIPPIVGYITLQDQWALRDRSLEFMKR